MTDACRGEVRTPAGPECPCPSPLVSQPGGYPKASGNPASSSPVRDRLTARGRAVRRAAAAIREEP